MATFKAVDIQYIINCHGVQCDNKSAHSVIRSIAHAIERQSVESERIRSISFALECAGMHPIDSTRWAIILLDEVNLGMKLEVPD